MKDPITNAPFTEEQLSAAKIPETTPSDDENSSIITVRSNASVNECMVRLNLAMDDGDSGDAETGLAGSYLTAVQHHQPPATAHITATTTATSSSSAVDDGNDGMQTIVEVVNPLISGQGYANTIAVGHNDSSAYPSFDPTDAAQLAEANLDSFDTYNTASELSLSDRMKNVLQELVKNERVRLSFSQSISDGDEDSDSDEQNDTDDDANEPLKHDSSDDESAVPRNAITETMTTTTTTTSAASAQVAPVTEENGNTVIAQLNIVDELSDSGNNDDIKNANIIDDVDFIYKNPNFLMAGDEIATTSQPTAAIQRNERDEKLKAKLLSELKVQPSGSNEPWTKDTLAVKITPPSTIITTTTTQSTNEPDNQQETPISIHDEAPPTPTSPTSLTETSSKSDSISSTGSGKRKKRKNRPRKK